MAESINRARRALLKADSASALLSFGTFGFNSSVFLITGDWKLDKNLPFETAALHNTFGVILTH